jgi:integrase
MSGKRKKGKRSYGSGSLFQYRGSWYGQWRVGNRLVKRKLGSVRKPGTREGLTKVQAEQMLRRLMREVKPTPQERLHLREVGDAYIAHLRDNMERKPTTIQDYGIILNAAERGLPKKTADRFVTDDIESYAAAMKARGLSTKTIANHLNFLHGLFAFTLRRGWTNVNPVVGVERPRGAGADPDIRFLDLEEVEDLLAAVSDDALGKVEWPLYLTALMCGLRQGELIALRWIDVDFKAGLIRVRRSYTRGRFGTPKSKKSSRAVPMPGRVAGALKAHRKRSMFIGKLDLVFCHPETGGPFDASKMRTRFKEALRRAGIRPIRIHDLRHTFGTQMAAAGAPLRYIQEWMGHSDYKTTEVYADFAPDPSQGASWAEAAFGEGEENERPDEDSGGSEGSADGDEEEGNEGDE